MTSHMLLNSLIYKNVLAKSNSNSIGDISITLLIFLNYMDRLDYDNLNEECTEILSDEIFMVV